MAKYTLTALLAIMVAVAVGLFLLSRIDGNDVAAGPAPVQTISVRQEGIFPRRFEVKKGQPVEIRLENRVTRYHYLDMFDDSVEQLIPVDSTLDPATPGFVHPNMHLESPGGETHSTTVRFNEAGEFELRLTVPTRSELEIITVVVQ